MSEAIYCSVSRVLLLALLLYHIVLAYIYRIRNFSLVWWALEQAGDSGSFDHNMSTNGAILHEIAQREGGVVIVLLLNLLSVSHLF